MSASFVQTAFLPSIHGFHFENKFNAELKDLFDSDAQAAACGAVLGWSVGEVAGAVAGGPFGGAIGAAAGAIIGGAGVLLIPKKIEHCCGGMCWAALDRYFGNTSATIPADREAPSPGSSLFKELFRRQIDSLDSLNVVWKCLDWMNRPDTGHTSDRHSVGHLVQTEEWPKVRDLLDKGIPASICIVLEKGIEDTFKVWNNHQLLIWKYGYDTGTKRVDLYAYDPNYPYCPEKNMMNADNITFSFTLGQRKSNLSPACSQGYSFRGFFNTDYDKSLVYVPQGAKASLRQADMDSSLQWLILGGPNNL